VGSGNRHPEQPDQRRRYLPPEAEGADKDTDLFDGDGRRAAFASLRARLGKHYPPRPRGRDLLRSSARFAGASGLLILGFALGWSIDPPAQRVAGDRIAIISETETQQQPSPPRLEDILSLEPAAGPGEGPAPSFLSPIEEAPARSDPTPKPAAPSASERLPALEDPALMERWDRVEVLPTPLGELPKATRQLAAAPDSERQRVERIALPGGPLSHGEPLYPDPEEAVSFYRVEMAAFAQPDLADAAKASLQRIHGDLLAGDHLRVAADGSGRERASYRVVADPLALETADQLCAALRTRGQGCLVIPMRGSPPVSN